MSKINKNLKRKNEEKNFNVKKIKQNEERKKKLTKDQERIIDIVVKKRKPVFITGSGGCRKSYTLNYLIGVLYKKIGKDKIGVTSSTGISSLNIRDSITLHKYTCIGIRDKPIEDYIKKIKENRYLHERWLKTEILIIDEISMVGDKTFDFIDELGRRIRGNNKLFGGIQLVVSGDFAQLRPIKEKNAFLSKVWKEIEFEK
ncbi:9732_t:CDS:1, partial [Scutellospora calospora]